MNHPQCASFIAMVRPAGFAYNEETASNNFFQKNKDQSSSIHQQALYQFDRMVEMLRMHNIDVLVLEDSLQPPKPDAIFPNNWFSCNNGIITIFPMQAKNRRLEKRENLINKIIISTGISNVQDLGSYENQNIFLEGTGSMIFDHPNKIAYACYSPRTDRSLFETYCKQIDYLDVGFHAADEQGRPVYHTNVVMCVGEKFAVVCLSAVSDEIDLHKIKHELSSTGHELIDITFGQMNLFAGNMLEVQNSNDEHFVLMSSTAYASLSQGQIARIENYAKILSPDISVIEQAAGGSVRCMMAELFCPKAKAL